MRQQVPQDSRVCHLCPGLGLVSHLNSKWHLSGTLVLTSQETGSALQYHGGADLKVTRCGSFCTCALLALWRSKHLWSPGPIVRELSEALVN